MLVESGDRVERAARREDRSPVPSERYQAACRVIVAAGTAKRTVRQESHPYPLEDAVQVRCVSRNRSSQTVRRTPSA
jgi:hypothetical protein